MRSGLSSAGITRLSLLTQCAALALSLGLAAAPALAQDAAPAPAAPTAQTPPAEGATPTAPVETVAPEWFKLCGTNEQNGAEICSVQSFAMAEGGNVVAEVRIIDVKAEQGNTRLFEAIIPPGFLVQPGVNLVFDDEQQPVAGRYRICFPNGCLVETNVDDAFIQKMKRGTNLVLYAANQDGNWVGANISLEGFTKAYDEGAVEAEVYEQWRQRFDASQQSVQQNLQAGLMRRAQEQRQRLQQGGEAAPAPAAPGATPPATPAPANR